jgi:hypothetical protein
MISDIEISVVFEEYVELVLSQTQFSYERFQVLAKAHEAMDQVLRAKMSHEAAISKGAGREKPKSVQTTDVEHAAQPACLEKAADHRGSLVAAIHAQDHLDDAADGGALRKVYAQARWSHHRHAQVVSELAALAELSA